MASKSPIRSRRPGSVSVCGKILGSGQSLTVKESAIGPRERKLAARKKIRIRKSNKKGMAQIVCTLNG